jgi:hypothetical protein
MPARCLSSPVLAWLPLIEISLPDGVAHARRVYSEHGIGLSAPISAESVQNKQPLVAPAPCVATRTFCLAFTCLIMSTHRDAVCNRSWLLESLRILE